MARKRDHERKTRGQQIRDTRTEKRDGQSPASGSRTDTALEEGPSAGELARGADSFDDDAFVETDAVRAVRRRIERWMRADRPVHLVGPTGCGKTALAMQVAQARDRPVVFVNGDADLTTANLVGEYAGEERESVRDRYVHNVIKSKDVVRDRWVDNPLTVAVREGATLVYNEFARTKPTANNVLLSVFEEGVLELPGRRGADRYVDVHPKFRAVLTSNSAEYAGVHTPQDALLDRLVGVHVDFYDAETERAIVASHVPAADEETVELVVETLRRVRADDDAGVRVGTRSMIMATEGLVVEGADAPFVEICVDALASKVPDIEAVAKLRAAVEQAAP